ncbi:hypothetical protein NESM_000316600 [Novymonas esmeraldas]|uniref:Uncharacterized protein n=1 Tax=Novymonas esmeraldas TaxID=1808958 RepID=A0AAW0EIY9_9TRYP
MESSLTDVECGRCPLTASQVAFQLPQVMRDRITDAPGTASQNMSAEQNPQQRKEPQGLSWQGGSAMNTSRESNAPIAGDSNSGSCGAQPNAPASLGGAVETDADEEPGADNGSGMAHLLVVFDRSFCVCFVPPPLRSNVKVGELVLCECAHGENIGTVVADVSALVAEVMQQRLESMTASAVEHMFTPPYEHVVSATAPSTAGGHSAGSFTATSLLYEEKPQGSLPSDHHLRRLPCVLRRGTNRDKKRVYFARLRSNDALATVHRILRSEPIVAQSAEYQVNFVCVTVYLSGERSQCPWAPHQFQYLGNTLVDPLRSETVEFRFTSDRHHDELDLTRAVTGASMTEVLYAAVADHQERQSGRSGAGGRGGGASRAIQPQQQSPHAPVQLFAAGPGMMTAYPNAAVWPQAPMALPPGAYVTQAPPPPAQQQAVSYTMGPYVYVSSSQQPPPPPPPPQQQHQPQQPHMHTITIPGHAPAATQPPNAPLSLVQLHYPHVGQANSAPGLYWANMPTTPSPQQCFEQQQQQTLPPPPSFAGTGVAEPSYYYVVSPAHQPTQVPPPQARPLPQVAPQTFMSATQLPAAGQAQQPTYVQVPLMNTQGYRTVSYPYALPHSAQPYS